MSSVLSATADCEIPDVLGVVVEVVAVQASCHLGGSENCGFFCFHQSAIQCFCALSDWSNIEQFSCGCVIELEKDAWLIFWEVR